MSSHAPLRYMQDPEARLILKHQYVSGEEVHSLGRSAMAPLEHVFLKPPISRCIRMHPSHLTLKWTTHQDAEIMQSTQS